MLLSGRNAVGAAGAVALMLSAGGCGTAPGKTAARTAPIASATTTTSSAPDPPAQEALASYGAMWADLAAVADSGNYQQSRLGDHMTGQLLLTSSQNLFLDEQHGMVTRGEPILLRPTATSEDLAAQPAEITISDCVDGSHFLIYYAATGKPVDSDPGGLQSATVQMTLSGGVWKASSEVIGAVGSCVR